MCKFLNVWQTQHQKQDNCHQKKRSPAPVLCLNPIEVYTCPWQNWQWMMRAQNCTNQIANVIKIIIVMFFSEYKLWVLLKMPSLFLSYRFQFNQHPRHNDGTIIAVILLFIRERNICKTWLMVCQSIQNMNIRSWSQIVFHTWAWCGWVLEKGSPAKYNVHQHPAPATISHS